jgi:hypothetical protein
LVLDARLKSAGMTNEKSMDDSFSAVFYAVGKNKNASEITKGVKLITLCTEARGCLLTKESPAHAPLRGAVWLHLVSMKISTFSVQDSSRSYAKKVFELCVSE